MPAHGYPHNADRFGGYADIPFTGTLLRGVPGRFHTGIMGERVVVVDPDGNVYPWLLVWNTGVPGSASRKASDGNTAPSVPFNGKSGQSYRDEKYGDNLHWCLAALSSLKKWGFTGTHGTPTYGHNTAASWHAVGGHTHSWVELDPRPPGGGTIDWAANQTAGRFNSPYPHPVPVPGTYLLSPSRYGVFSGSAFKTMLRYGPFAPPASWTINATYYGPAGNVHFPDIFDQKWADTIAAYAAVPPNSKWIVGLCMDDADFLRGFGAGPDFVTDAPSRNQPHAAFSCAVSKPWITQITNWDGDTFTVAAGNEQNHTKYAFRDFLIARHGTIEALNAAWGSNYTTFDMEDEVGHTSWGTGSGLMDEDGRNPWFGGAPGAPNRQNVSLGFLHLVTPAMPAALLADLDEWLYLMAARYFSVNKAAVSAAKPGMLYIGQAVFGGWGCPPHRSVLRAAGEHLDVAQVQMVSTVNPQDNAAKAEFVATHLGPTPLPVAIWWGNVANTDAAFEGFPGGFPTQEARAAAYDQGLKTLLETRFPGTGLFQGVGASLWEMYDNWSEVANWGFRTIRHGDYDGIMGSTTPPMHETVVIPIPVSPFSVTRQYVNIPEDNDYGDYLNPTKQTHLDVEAIYALQVGGTPPPPPPPPDPEVLMVLHLDISHQLQEHTTEYTNQRNRFQRSTDGGVSWADVQSNIVPLGTTGDDYSVLVGESGHYRGVVDLTDGVVFSPPLVSNVAQVAVFEILTPQTITLSIA